MRFSYVLSLLGLSLIGAPDAPAQQPPTPPQAPASGAPAILMSPALNPASHVLQSGDQLELNIFSLPDLPKSYTVRADGRFNHPVIGEVKAAGVTVSSLEKLIRARLSKELRDPGFSLGLVSVSQMDVSVLGEVGKAGKYTLPTGTSLLELLAQVGGVTAKADPDGAYIIRQGQQVPVNLSTANQPKLASFSMRPGDIFFVNPGRRVSVVGEVREPGIYAVSAKSTTQFEDAIKAAGGTKETAAAGRILLVRPTLEKPLTVDLLSPPKNGSYPELTDGDTVVVQPRAVIVLGAVSKAGPMPLEGSETLVDVLSKAGLSQGKLDQVVVIRASDVREGNEKRETYDVEKYLKEASSLVPVPVHDGDLVYVPPQDAPGGGLLGGGGLLQLLLMARTFTSF
ncbi:MAG: SLBB domain-containing protein [Candidatus Eremiobacteraeota bacterium]|nr:SLBB domain-containing protein [Candidatus Eremiobacteraeota bacterium]